MCMHGIIVMYAIMSMHTIMPVIIAMHAIAGKIAMMDIHEWKPKFKCGIA